MMKKLATFMAVVALNGCAVVASPVGNGALFTATKGPVTATNLESASKSGEACSQNLLGFIVSGDASIATAKKAGNISKVATVDHSFVSFLGLYSQFCTQVTGE